MHPVLTLAIGSFFCYNRENTEGYRMSIVLIDAQTAASTGSQGFSVPSLGQSVGLKSSGLAGSEVVTIQVEVNGTFIDLVEGGAVVTLTVANPHRTINGSGIYRVTKLSTAGAVTVTAG